MSIRKDKFQGEARAPEEGHGEDTEPLLQVNSALETLLGHMGLTYQAKTRNSIRGNKTGWGQIVTERDGSWGPVWGGM